MNNIYVFGECMIELRSNKDLSGNDTVSSKTLQQGFAGDVLNTAVYLKRTFPEINTHFISAVGKDKFSIDMLSFFKNEQVGTDLVFQSEEKMPGLYAIETDDTGERTFTYWRENSAAKEVMSFIDEKAINQLSTGDVFFFSGISLAVIQPKDRALFWQMVTKLKQNGVNIVFDPNYRARMWDSQAQAKEQFEQAFTLAEVALPGVDDFSQLYQLTTSEAVFEFCQKYNFKELIIKNGEKGVFCYAGDQAFHFDVVPVANVVDTTSAGDSFNGAYLGARASGIAILEAVELASNIAGFVVQHQGAIVDSQAYQLFITKHLKNIT
jgi:2-dehydro-3-deoxygluconokinase